MPDLRCAGGVSCDTDARWAVLATTNSAPSWSEMSHLFWLANSNTQSIKIQSAIKFYFTSI